MPTDNEYEIVYHDLVATLRKKGLTDDDLLALATLINTDDNFTKDLLDTLRKEKNG